MSLITSNSRLSWKLISLLNNDITIVNNDNVSISMLTRFRDVIQGWTSNSFKTRETIRDGGRWSVTCTFLGFWNDTVVNAYRRKNSCITARSGIKRYFLNYSFHISKDISLKNNDLNPNFNYVWLFRWQKCHFKFVSVSVMAVKRTLSSQKVVFNNFKVKVGCWIWSNSILVTKFDLEFNIFSKITFFLSRIQNSSDSYILV